MSTNLTPSSAVTSPPANDFIQALNDLLPKQFAEYRSMTPAVREILTETLWYQNTTELFVVIAPAILGTKFLSEILPVYAPMIRVLHRLAVANGKMTADNPMRRTWRMIGHTPTTCINTNGQEVAIQPDDAICWAAICAEVFRTSPSYVNKLTTEVPLLPPLPEEATEAEKSSDTRSGGADDGSEAGNEDAGAKNGGSATTKKATRKKRKTAKGATSATEKPEPDTGKSVVLIPAPDLQKGDVEALYKFLDGNGANGLVPLDAVFGGLEEGEFQSKLSRFSNKIAYAFFPNELNVRVERVGDESKSPVPQLKARVVELEAQLVHVQSQMQMMADQAAEHPEQTCAQFTEWLEEQR